MARTKTANSTTNGNSSSTPKTRKARTAQEKFLLVTHPDGSQLIAVGTRQAVEGAVKVPQPTVMVIAPGDVAVLTASGVPVKSVAALIAGAAEPSEPADQQDVAPSYGTPVSTALQPGDADGDRDASL